MDRRRRHPFDDGCGIIEFAAAPKEEPVPIAVPIVHDELCPACQIPMVHAHTGGRLCKKCGTVDETEAFEIDISNESGVDQYNTSESSSMATKVIGIGRNGQRNVIQSSSGPSNNRAAQHRIIINQITAIINSTPNHGIPPKVISDAADFFWQVQENKTLRGDVRKGTQAACVHLMCRPNGIARSAREIAKLFNIEQSEVSGGEKILDELIHRGLITRPFILEDQSEDEQISNLLTRHFSALNIVTKCREVDIDPEQVREFCRKLIRFTIKYRVAETSIISSKCVGSIALYLRFSKRLNIDRELIDKECNISKTTFARFETAVLNFLASTDPQNEVVRGRLRVLFQTYGLMEKRRAPKPKLGIRRSAPSTTADVNKPANTPSVSGNEAPLDDVILDDAGLD